MENEAKFVGSCSGLLFELGINDLVRVRKFSKPKKSRDFNFCQTELLFESSVICVDAEKSYVCKGVAVKHPIVKR